MRFGALITQLPPRRVVIITISDFFLVNLQKVLEVSFSTPELPSLSLRLEVISPDVYNARGWRTAEKTASSLP